ncbi:MAG: tetratricopeptide repeat protein [Anaeromyxobacter sp.]
MARTRSSASRPANTSLLGKTAGLLCEQDGNLLRAASYYDEAIATEGPEPFTLVALADVYFRLGRIDEAHDCLRRAEALAQSAGDDEDRQLVAAAQARWRRPGPDLHDAVIEELHLDLAAGTALVWFRTAAGRVSIAAEGVLLVKAPRREPWGGGGSAYVNEVRGPRPIHAGSEASRIEIELQSGDVLEIEAVKIAIRSPQ